MNRRQMLLGGLAGCVTAYLSGSKAGWGKNGGRSINIREHGARGDGITDDTAALQAALLLAGRQGIPLHFAKGTYLISASIIVPAQTVLISADHAVLLVHDASSMQPFQAHGGVEARAFFLFLGGQSPASHRYHVSVQGLTIHCTDKKHHTVAFHCPGAWESIRFERCTSAGLRLTFAHVGALFYTPKGTNPNYFAHSAINHFSAIRCRIRDGGNGQNPSGFHVFGSRSSVVQDNLFEQSDGYMLRFDGGAFNTVPSSTDGSTNILIGQNRFVNWGDRSNAIQCAKSSNILVHRNQFLSNRLVSDHSVDFFNCFNVRYELNRIKGAGALFFGHADLNFADHPGDLAGARNCLAVHNTVVNPTGYAIFTFGGDGTVDGNRAMHNALVEGNLVVSRQPATNDFIKCFLTNNITIRNNRVQRCRSFIRSFYDKNINITANTIEDIPKLVTVEGADGMTAPTHRYENNRLLNSGGAGGFSDLTRT